MLLVDILKYCLYMSITVVFLKNLGSKSRMSDIILFFIIVRSNRDTFSLLLSVRSNHQDVSFLLLLYLFVLRAR